MKKKVAIGCGTIAAIAIVGGILLFVWFNSLISDNLSKREIFDAVNDNYEIILEDIKENDFSDTKKIEGIQEIYVENGVADVYCGGKGMGSATSYYGFYYTPDDMPRDNWAGKHFGDTGNLKQDGKGFSIKYSDDDNYYYTEKIRDNFYYYEAHF